MESELNVMLVNARHARNLPGRKTDVSDAQWLAELGAHGLVRPSFVPPEPIRELRGLTRARATFTQERTREIQRLEAAGGRRVEALVGGNPDHRSLGSSDARCPDRG